MAEKIIDENKHLLNYKPGILTQKLITSRARFFDQQVRRIYEKTPHQNLALVNLGGGLCSRFSRVSKCLSNSIHLDLPEVIELLKQLFLKRQIISSLKISTKAHGQRPWQRI